MRLFGIFAEFVRRVKRYSDCSFFNRLFHGYRSQKREKKNFFAGNGRDNFIFIDVCVELVQYYISFTFRFLSYTTYCINIRRTDWRRTKPPQRESGRKTVAPGSLETFFLFYERRLRIIYGRRPHSIHITSDVMFHCFGEASTSQNF